jgi:hypothetical protein
MLIKNRFGRMVDVSPEIADEMFKKGEAFKIEGSLEEPKVINELECPYCGKVCGNKIGYKKHTEACKKKAL